MKKLMILLLASLVFLPTVDACDCGCADLANATSDSRLGRLRAYNACIGLCTDSPCTTSIETETTEDETVPV